MRETQMWKVLLGLWLIPVIAAADSRPALYVDLTGQFARFVDESADVDEPARVALFYTEMGPLLPGFYSPRFGATQAQYDARIAQAIRDFGTLRARYEDVQRGFPSAFEAGVQHFRKEF